MKFITILVLVVIMLVGTTAAMRKRKEQSGHSAKKVTFPGKSDRRVMDRLEKNLLKEFKKDESLIAGLVRILFHDCIPFCDGCVDISNSDNRGLGSIQTLLLRLRADHAPSWSQADVNIYCGLRAAREAAIRAGGDLKLKMHINRRTCQGRLPHRTIPFGGHASGLQTLIDLYRLTKPQAVALLGAHSLGRCRPSRAGFNGAWDRTPTALDTGYFSNLVNLDWVAGPIKNSNVDSHQWGIAGSVGSSPMMLNTDMAILIDFKTGAKDRPSCDLHTCPRASRTARIAKRFAGNMKRFHKAFQKGIQKMVNTGYRNLKFVDFV